jgi:Second Messenger Oligonucleotide or Dinucleotide Synthetase domain
MFMSGDEYLQGVIHKYTVDASGAENAANSIYRVIHTWANGYLTEAKFSGSLAKGTAISLGTDADLFLSLSSVTPGTLSEIYNSLHKAVTNAGYTARKQNVSIGVSIGKYKIDLVPGRRQSQYGDYHSLYKNKTNSWTQTNIDTHISAVRNSNRLDEIKLTKIWRELHGLNFPSFYLELVVIDCLKGYRYGQLALNFSKVLSFLSSELQNRRYLDPANTNNIISDDLSDDEKHLVAIQALVSINKQSWQEVVW